MELRYNGVDIYDKVSINQCIYDSYGEKQSDTLRMTFSDAADVWDGWSPGNGDKVSVTLGAAKTGDMYITSVRPENGIMTLRASSTPETHNDVSNKSWENVHFKQICEEIANRHGLKCEFHGVEDQTYQYVTQENKEDFVFLEDRCVLEGCAFLVYDGKLVVYSESAIESTASDNTLEVTNDVKFEYKECVYDRVKGIDPSLLDQPEEIAAPLFEADAKWLIQTYEPRVKVDEVNMDALREEQGNFALNINARLEDES